MLKRFWNRTADDPVSVAIRVLVIIALLIFLVMVLLNARSARADVLAIGDRDGVTLMLTNEPCAIPGIAGKYPVKVQRVERGQLSSGCYDIRNGNIMIAHFPPGTWLMWSKEIFSIVKGM